jgi:hypothetical protein
VSEREDALEEAAAMLDSWAEHDERVGDNESAEALWLAAKSIRARKIPGAMEKCHCDGCPERVETWSRSGLCYDCANEDCDHDAREAAGQ